MLCLNRVTLAGVIIDEPTAFDGRGGTGARFRLRTQENWKAGPNGEAREREDTHRIVIYNPTLAKLCLERAQRGCRVFVEGSLQSRPFEKDGVRQQSIEIVLGAHKSTFTVITGPQTDEAAAA